jgi:DUF1365 family protein
MNSAATATASALYVGDVMHQRFYPLAYRFNYSVFSVLLDLEDIEAGFPNNRLLSHNRFNLLSFYDRDHGAHSSQALRPWLEQALFQAGVNVPLGRARINAYPRILGYQFNPMTTWYCEDQAGDMIAIVCTVSNTFGQWHHYILHNQGEALAWPFEAQADKVFHVSPFIDMPMRYHFRFLPPDERLVVHILETEGDKRLLVATHVAHQQPLTDGNLLKQCLRIPFLTLKVITLIHWQALKIWLKGARLFPAPPHPEKDSSVCKQNTPKI